jgi:hypothetical protein
MVFPNPTDGWVIIQFEGQTDKDVILEVLSVKGDILYKSMTRIVNNQIEVDLLPMNQGSYFIRLVSKDFSKVFKIIKR